MGILDNSRRAAEMARKAEAYDRMADEAKQNNVFSAGVQEGGLARQAEVDQHILDKVNMLQTFGKMSNGGLGNMVTLRDELGTGPVYEHTGLAQRGVTIPDGLTYEQAMQANEFNQGVR